MRRLFLAAALAFAWPAFAQIPVPEIPRTGPVLGPGGPQTAAQQPTDPVLARQPIEALEADILGACAQNDRAIARVSGGEAPVRLAIERQMRARGVRTYRYVYRATGCGRAPRRHNIEIMTRESLPPLAIALPMGTTAVTSAVLDGVFDTLFTPMMRERHPDCEPRRLKVREANISSGAPYTRGGAWTETWTYDACGARGAAEIVFAYDGEGLQIRGRITPAE